MALVYRLFLDVMDTMDSFTLKWEVNLNDIYNLYLKIEPCKLSFPNSFFIIYKRFDLLIYLISIFIQFVNCSLNRLTQRLASGSGMFWKS